MSDRNFITVYDHPAFAPNAVPPVPSLRFPDGTGLPGLGEVLFLPLNDLVALPLGYLNLLCATALPDAGNLNIPACMRTLAQWTEMVARETARHLWKFRQRPAEYENSEPYYRMLVLVTVLQRDCGVTYDASAMNVKTFASSREGFIHGLLSGKKQGTCANMPVLVAAVARNLGYPVYLVAAKGHVFCRWHDAKTGERLNIEASGLGLTTPTDAEYAAWPQRITNEEIHHGIYLRDLGPADELAMFMMTRGHVLFDAKHLLDATVAYAHAHRLAPTDPHAMAFLLGSLNHEIDLRQDGTLPNTYRQAELFKRKDCPPLALYTIDSHYTTRAAGTNLNGKQRGRVDRPN